MIITRMIRIKNNTIINYLKKGKFLVVILDFLDKNHCNNQ